MVPNKVFLVNMNFGTLRQDSPVAGTGGKVAKQIELEQKTNFQKATAVSHLVQSFVRLLCLVMIST